MKKSLCLFLTAVLLCGCSSSEQPENITGPETETQTAETDTAETAETETAEAETAETAEAETEKPEDQPAYACRTFNYYDYGKPVKAAEPVGDEYYQDMFVAGDSRVGSLYLYSDLRAKGAQLWYTTSISLWRIYDVGPDEGSDQPMFDLIMDTDRHNIYILIGINEIRNDNFDAWGEEFESVIDELLTNHGDDDIYLILNYQPRGLANIDDASLWTHVEEENRRMAEIAEKKHIYYIDISDEMTDDAGLIRGDYVWDGLHFNAQGTREFADYLARHVVRRENYVKEICE